jgi:pimeloyl-ACP methyl ester carboxylesterase
MVPPVDLPPPPERPELSPEVQIAGEEELFVPAEGARRQALALLPAAAERVVVLCHPRPRCGGTMHNAVVVVLAKALAEAGGGRVGWLRFNFRGVGKSQGRYDAGRAEEHEFSSPEEETSELAGRLHATLSVVPEAEHDFIRFRREVARLVVPFVAPELSP